MNSLSFSEEIRQKQDVLATPPFAPQRYTLVTALRQYRLMLWSQLAEYRLDWIMHVFAGFIIPFVLVFFAKAVGGTISPQRAVFLLGGNMTMAVAFGPLTFLISKIGWARQTEDYKYWISLPIPKLILILVLVSVGLLFSLPGIVGIYVFGCLFLGVPFSGGALLVLFIPLGVFPLATLGVFLGSYMPNGQLANVCGNFLAVFVSLLSPLMISPDALPLPLRALSWAMPTTYVADAFRAVIGGQVGMNLVLDAVILGVLSVVCMLIAYWKINWRMV